MLYYCTNILLLTYIGLFCQSGLIKYLYNKTDPYDIFQLNTHHHPIWPKQYMYGNKNYNNITIYNIKDRDHLMELSNEILIDNNLDEYTFNLMFTSQIKDSVSIWIKKPRTYDIKFTKLNEYNHCPSLNTTFFHDNNNFQLKSCLEVWTLKVES